MGGCGVHRVHSPPPPINKPNHLSVLIVDWCATPPRDTPHLFQDDPRWGMGGNGGHWGGNRGNWGALGVTGRHWGGHRAHWGALGVPRSPGGYWGALGGEVGPPLKLPPPHRPPPSVLYFGVHWGQDPPPVVGGARGRGSTVELRWEHVWSL